MEPVVRRRGLGDELGEEEQTEGARALVGRRLSDDLTERKKALDEWRPRRLTASDPGFDDEEVCLRAKTYLDSWKRRNYGAMAGLISPQLGNGTPSATAGRVREEFESWKLDDYTLVAAAFEAAAVCEIDIDLMIDGEKKPANAMDPGRRRGRTRNAK